MVITIKQIHKKCEIIITLLCNLFYKKLNYVPGALIHNTGTKSRLRTKLPQDVLLSDIEESNPPKNHPDL